MLRQVQGCIIRYGYIGRMNCYLEHVIWEVIEVPTDISWKNFPLCPTGRLEGEQNLSPQNMPLCHEDYFELKVVKTQQIQE